MMAIKPDVDIRDATHILLYDDRWVRIKYKWGVSPEGNLAKPSEGGFGVVTQEGERIDMYHARRYGKEE